MQKTIPAEYVNEIGAAVSRPDNFNAVFWILIGINLVIFAIIKTTRPDHINGLFGGIIQNRQFLMNSREEQGSRGIATFLLSLAYFNCVGIIVWMLSGVLNKYFILIFVASLMILAGLKLILIRGLSYVMNTREGLFDHFANHLIFFQVGGILLTPILIFIFYIPADYSGVVQLALVIFLGLLIIFRETLSLLRSIQSNISVLYIILYLCTLEILPLMVGYRVISLETEAF